MQRELNESFDRVTSAAQRRTSQLRGIELQARSYIAHPTPEGLKEIGLSMRELLSASQEAGQTSIPPKVVPIDGLAQIRGDLLGNQQHPREMWDFKHDGTGTIVMPVVTHGVSRITNNIDKTPFLQKPRKVRFTTRGVDEAGRQDFACFVKSDIGLGSDGDRHADDSKSVNDDGIILVSQAEADDRAFYLAWRGRTMTMEEFDRRYPDAAVVLELLPD